MASILKEKQNFLLLVVSGANISKRSCVWCQIPSDIHATYLLNRLRIRGEVRREQRSVVPPSLLHNLLPKLGLLIESA